MTDALITNEVDLSSIEAVESAPAFDAREFDGVRVKIATVKQITVDSHYVEGTFNPDKTVKLDMIEIETESVTEIGTDENKKPITARARFSLQKANTGKLFISKHPKAKLWKFMRKLGVEKLPDMKGKFVTLTAEASKDEHDDRYWLRIVV